MWSLEERVERGYGLALRGSVFADFSSLLMFPDK